MIRNAVLNRTLIVLTLHLFLRSQATAGRSNGSARSKPLNRKGR